MAYGVTVEIPATTPAETQYLWGRRFDLFWIAGGGFFVVALVVLPIANVDGLGAALTATFLHLAILCNYPHYAATYQIIVRERVAKPRPFRWLILSTPLMLGLLVLAAFFPDLLVAPLVRLYLTWSVYHYSAQNYGISVLYGVRFGRPLVDREKLFLQAAFVGTGAFMILMANAVGGDPATAARVVGLAENGGTIPTVGFPSWIYWPGLGMVAASFGAFAWADALYKNRTGHHLDIAVWMLLLTTFAWFVVPNLRTPSGTPWMPEALTVCLLGAPPFFHCAQYLAVTFWRSRTTGNVRPVWLGAALVAIGFVLFQATRPLVPAILPIDSLRGMLLLLAVINLHHFWMDGLMWRRPAKKAAPAPSAAVPA